MPKPINALSIVRDVLPPKMAKEIWEIYYLKAWPIAINNFELSAVLPAIFYMFRFGQRRGRGQFLKAFGKLENRKNTVTVEQVAEILAASPNLSGFESPIAKAILGDLLLCYCLENTRHSLGRDQKIQRVAPVHYMSSWIDLPDKFTDLRYVPEMIVAMLADQEGEVVKPNLPKERTRFPVAANHNENLLLGSFSQGIQWDINIADLAADAFDEQDSRVGADQLLMVRLAQQLGRAPEKPRDSAISNQRPIAKKSAQHFSDDIRRFVRSYAKVIPRYAFIDMLESGIATGMMSILTSSVGILFEWAESGYVYEMQHQQPARIFVDCSNGVDRKLRGVAEQSMDDLMRRLERILSILMVLRLLDYEARDNRHIKKENIPTRPYATEWLKLLGDLLYGRHSEATFIHRKMEDHAEKLSVALCEAFPDTKEMLCNVESQPNPVLRLGTALTSLRGPAARSNFIKMVDSTLHMGRPNGLARKRNTTRGAQVSGSTRRFREVRSLIFNDSILDYLVHLSLLPSGSKSGIQPLSLRGFLDRIRQRYGLHVDSAPPGMTISNELLQSNRAILERRLRDLGLLVGVNDADYMKRLTPRFHPATGN